jgi:hypothetical protein
MKNESFEKIKNTFNLITDYSEKTKNRIEGSFLFALFDLYKDDAQIKAKVASLFEGDQEVYADVVSSQENPNCSCRGRFASFITRNFHKCYAYFEELFKTDLIDDEKAEKMASTVINSWSVFLVKEKERLQNNLEALPSDATSEDGSKNVELPDNVKTVEATRSLGNIAGTIFTIENNEKNYKAFVENIKTSSFTGMSIVEHGNRLKIFVY